MVHAELRSLSEVRETTREWIAEYHRDRPHAALGGMTPHRYAAVTP